MRSSNWQSKLQALASDVYDVCNVCQYEIFIPTSACPSPGNRDHKFNILNLSYIIEITIDSLILRRWSGYQETAVQATLQLLGEEVKLRWCGIYDLGKYDYLMSI